VRKLFLTFLMGGLFSCGAAKTHQLYSSTTTSPYFINEQAGTLTFQYETQKCMAGFPVTDQVKVILPKNTICTDSALSKSFSFVLDGVGGILGGMVKAGAAAP